METEEETREDLAAESAPTGPEPLAELQHAVRHGNTEAVSRILGGRPGLANAPSTRGGSLLLEAFEREADDIADLFVAARNDRGITELDIHEACAMGRAGIVQKRLTDDPLVFEEVGPTGFFPLHRAAYRGHVDAVSLLLQMGADPNARSQNGASLTPLHSAVAGAARFAVDETNGQSFRAVSERLIAAGADAELEMEGAWSAITAAERDNLHALLPVLRPAVDPSAPSNEDAATPLG
ncbi:Ankyrin repeats (3 copies) [Planctomycetes bacterium Poly30]|uniref:Ankyrin repeats (3 copies) n=1 Tax=Saltatorellus ferox TaxID=2528018 RepID=A0A518ESC8_9BACT|nr:Ankyrin repeats (3 copies) [Planctomycetes bacterium Poly30]